MIFVNVMNNENIIDFRFQMFANDNVDMNRVWTVEFEEYTEIHHWLMVIRHDEDFLRSYSHRIRIET